MTPLSSVPIVATILSLLSPQLASSQPTSAHTSLTPVNSPYTEPADFNPKAVPAVSDAGEPVLKSFVSFSLEHVFFPDFAGNKSNPNDYSNNLLENLGKLQGSKPDIRVGGNTQDFALFNASLKTATYGVYTNDSSDYPRYITIGPSYFESYETWPNVKFVHGFNLGDNTTEGAESLTNSVPYACKALSHGNFLYWEMGNEPDLFINSSVLRRPDNWNETDYVKEWNENVERIKDALAKDCGEEWVSAKQFQWIAPSFARTNVSLDTVKAWKFGLDKSDYIAKFSSHNYIGVSTAPGLTLANTLMNHTKTVASVAVHNYEQKALADAGMKLDYIMGETNSLARQGKPGLSNSFGAALWGVDFNLLCASTDIKQVFMHQGTDYRYASWQPVQTNKTTIGTKPPYYGNVAVAASLGDITKSSVRVANIPLEQETEAAYAIYSNETLSRLVVINLNQYNYSVPTPLERPNPAYNFTVPTDCKGTATVQRLIANGSDATTGITFDGYSFNYELDNGKPKLLENVTRGEIVYVGSNGSVSVQVPDSSAALVHLKC